MSSSGFGYGNARNSVDIENTEDCSVRADAEHHCQHRYHRKAEIFSQHSGRRT
jgi:hypothetical protein